MHKCFLPIVLGLLFLFPAATFGYGHYTVYSTVPADVYLDNEYSATISATQSLKLILSGPQTYVIGVRAKGTEQTHKESVIVGANKNEHREIRAFSNVLVPNTEITVYSTVPAEVYIDYVFKGTVDSTHPFALILPGPRSYLFEIRAKDSNMIFREEVSIDPNSAVRREVRAFAEVPAPIIIASGTVAPVAVPQGGITREEMASEIKKATTQAKAEALAEEAGRRKRAGKRAVTNKGIAHVVGVEANSGLSSSVKNMERIKLLIEAFPALSK